MQSISPNNFRCLTDELNAAALRGYGATGTPTQLRSTASPWRQERVGYSGVWNANPWSNSRDRFCAALRSQRPIDSAQHTAALNTWENEGGAAASKTRRERPASAFDVRG
jgi:hypothetical protein